MIDPRDLSDLSALYAKSTGALLSGCYYQCTPSTAVTTNNVLGNGNLRVAPFPVPRGVALTQIGAEITAVGDTGSTLRLGIYADNGNGYPGNLILDAGTIPADAVAVAQIAISAKLPTGLYWVGAVVQGVTTTQPTVRSLSQSTNGSLVPLTTGGAPTAGAVPNIGFTGLGITGALPSTFPTTVNLTQTAARVVVKTA